MEEFYKQAQATASEAVREKWKACVLYAVKQGRPITDVRCEFSFRPDDATIKMLEDAHIKLQVDHTPAWTDDSAETYSLRHWPETWTVKVRPPQ